MVTEKATVMSMTETMSYFFTRGQPLISRKACHSGWFQTKASRYQKG